MVKFSRHIVSYGDTIQTITQKYLGDMHRWGEIAEFNNLRYPYITESLEERNERPDNLVTIGDTLLIPVTEVGKKDLISMLKRTDEYNQEEVMSMALGKDIDIMPVEGFLGQITSDAEVLELKDDGRGRLKTRRGVENLKQALYTRICTPKGSYLGHVDYGSDVQQYIGMKGGQETTTLINLELERTIRSDGRVEDVILNGFRQKGETYMVSFQIKALSLDDAFEFVIGTEDEGNIVMLDSF